MDMNALDLKGYYQNREKIPDLIVETAFLSATYIAAPTACNMSCTFDVAFCECEQAINDNFDWIRNKGPTLSPNTGPPHDHTTGGRNRKCYLVLFQIQQSLGRAQRGSSNRKSRQLISWALSRAFCSSQEFVLGWMNSAAHLWACNVCNICL